MTSEDNPSVQSLIKTRVLVLGGSGFIGRNLCYSLRQKAASVKVFCRSPFRMDGVEWISGDFLDGSAIRLAVANTDAVVHLVGTTTPASSNLRVAADAEENILGTVRLLEACCEAKVQKLVFASSGGTVYGECEDSPIPESHATNPICAYGISKLAVEKYVALYSLLYDLKGVVLRIANPYGPHQTGERKQGFIGAAIGRVMSGREVEVWGDGSIVRDYVYIRDVVRALELAIGYSGTTQILNIGSGKGVALNEILATIGEVAGRMPIVRYMPARAVDVKSISLETSLAKRELDWSSEIPLKAGVAETLTWFLNSNKPESKWVST